MFDQNDEKKLDWMYKGANSMVDREEYLLGRNIDKTLEQLNAEEKQKQLGIVPPKNHVEHECIPPSIRDYKLQQALAEQVDLQAKLQEDPLLSIQKREEETRRQFLQNPVQLKKLQKALSKQQKKSKKSKRDLDEKLEYLMDNPLGMERQNKKSKKDKDLDIILMHKFNAMKSKLTEKDLTDIMQGNLTDSDSDDCSEEAEIESEDEYTKFKNRKHNQKTKFVEEKNLKKRFKKKKKIVTSEDSSEEEVRKHKSSKKKKKRDSSSSDDDSDSSDSSEDEPKKKKKKVSKSKKHSKGGKEGKKKSKKSKKKVESSDDSSSTSTSSSSSSSSSEEDEKKAKHSKKNKRNKSKKRSISIDKIKAQKKQNSPDRKFRNRDNSRGRDDAYKSDRRNRSRSRDHVRLRNNSPEKSYRNDRWPKSRDDVRRRNYDSRRRSFDRKESSRRDRNRSRSVERESSHSRSRNKDRSEENQRSGSMEKLDKYRECRNRSNSVEKPVPDETKKTLGPERPPDYYANSNSEDEEAPKIKNWGLVKSDGTKIPLGVGGPKPMVQKKEEVAETKKEVPVKRKKLSEEEKEKIRQEMMQNAAWRDEQREKNVKAYREKDSKEEVKDFDPDFMHKELVKTSDNSTTVEGRIREKLNNIQRSGRDMNSHFLKR